MPVVDPEATFDFTTRLPAEGYGTAIQVDYANVRGDAIVGEMSNTSSLPFNILYVNALCFDEQGAITYSGSGDARTGPYGSGDTSTFSVPIYSNDCERFVVTAFGNPF